MNVINNISSSLACYFSSNAYMNLFTRIEKELENFTNSGDCLSLRYLLTPHWRYVSREMLKVYIKKLVPV